MMFKTVDWYLEEDYIRVHQKDFDLIKQVSVGLEESNAQLTSEVREVKEENDRLSALLKIKERMWNDKMNANLLLQDSINEKLVEKDKELKIAKDNLEQEKQDNDLIRQKLAEKVCLCRELSAQIEAHTKRASEHNVPCLPEIPTTPTGECENCRHQLEEFQQKYQEQNQTMAALEAQLFNRDTSSTLFELTTESTEIMQAKIDSLVKALKVMYERDAALRDTIREYCSESEQREKRNRAVSAFLAIITALLYFVVVIM
eukprot:Phypoly_transcript_16591.p1 GENE.Phypoly_transcript_16591~~Phypoly_transcript_16591.p1  ORF type:complete len:259 (+),score=35.87 Phypoly_transcript_16591:43-819(+)